MILCPAVRRKEHILSSTAWIFPRTEHVRDLGEDKTPYYVGWYEPDGRRKKESCGPDGRGED